MLKRIGALCVCLLLPHTAKAETIVSFGDGTVTWLGFGTVDRGFTSRPDYPIPPIGTPVNLTFSFNPGATFNPGGWPAGSPCAGTNAAGSLDLGGVDYNVSGYGFLHALLPGSSCSPPGGFTQFTFGLTPVDENPYKTFQGALILSYRDLLMADAFGDTPPATASWWLQAPVGLGAIWEVGGVLALSAVTEQPAPVPEPGSMTLLAIGLTGVARYVRSKRRSAA